MANYIIQGETLKAIADEVRDLVDITDEINPNEMIANMEQANADVAAQMEIIEQIRIALDGKAGSNAAEIGVIIDNSGVLDSTEGTVEEKVERLIDLAEIEKVWYETSERITNINNLFKGHQGVTIPRTNFISATSCGRFIENSKVEYIDYYINTPKVTSFQYGFANAPLLKRMKGFNTSNASQVNGVLMGDSLLETIEEPFDFSKVTANMGLAFNGCNALKDISFVAECIKLSISIPSAVLSAESIQSIIDGLATVETAQTLTLHADAKILQSQVDTANAKGWTVAGGTVVSEEEYYG